MSRRRIRADIEAAYPETKAIAEQLVLAANGPSWRRCRCGRT